MATWIKIYSNREWRNTRIIDEEKILQLNIYEAVEEMEIVYPNGLFKRSFWIKKQKDSEYNYLEELGKKI